ncbi:MAG: substrate binding domain-containing protein [Chthoniobacterales bacterium]
MEDCFVDLLSEGYDAVVRHGPVNDKRIIVKPLAGSRRMLVASPEYLKRHRSPTSLQDLERHRGIIHSHRGASDRRFRTGRKFVTVRPVTALNLNTGLSMRDAAVAGLGIALLATFIWKYSSGSVCWKLSMWARRQKGRRSTSSNARSRLSSPNYSATVGRGIATGRAPNPGRRCPLRSGWLGLLWLGVKPEKSSEFIGRLMDGQAQALSFDFNCAQARSGFSRCSQIEFTFVIEARCDASMAQEFRSSFNLSKSASNCGSLLSFLNVSINRSKEASA